MPPFRIPFTSKKPATANGVDPFSEVKTPADDANTPHKDRPSLALGIKGSREEPNEFKLSAVNDSGVYLPPSPPEKKSFWHKSPTGKSTTSSHHRSTLAENEPFSISRESFESYRRSFDISGRSPILQADSYPSRSSLDSRSSRLPRSAIHSNQFEKPRPTEEEEFEDVGLNDPKPKKKSFLSRFGESANNENAPPSTNGDGRPTSNGHHGFISHIPGMSGRKRGQSGTGAELGAMESERPTSKGQNDGVIR